MHHQFSTYYEMDKKMRERELAHELEQKYWVEQATRCYRPRRLRRLRSLLALIIGFFVRV